MLKSLIYKFFQFIFISLQPPLPRGQNLQGLKTKALSLLKPGLFSPTAYQIPSQNQTWQNLEICSQISYFVIMVHNHLHPMPRNKFILYFISTRSPCIFSLRFSVIAAAALFYWSRLCKEHKQVIFADSVETSFLLNKSYV